LSVEASFFRLTKRLRTASLQSLFLAEAGEKLNQSINNDFLRSFSGQTFLAGKYPGRTKAEERQKRVIFSEKYFLI